jgi:hypothetical protein
VYHAVNGTNRVSQIIELVQLGEFEVCKALANLLTAGLVVPVGVAEVRDGAPDVGVASGRLRAWLSATVQGTANLILIAALSAGAIWYGVGTWDQIKAVLESDLRSMRLVIHPHHLKTLRELIHVWRSDRGNLPSSVFEAMVAYGASTWPLSDPWGKPWIYDPITDTVSADEPASGSD